MTQPLPGFPADTFARRRARVLEELDGGAMLLPAAPLRYRSRDTEYRYRPDSELFYLTGWVEPRAVALLSDAPSTDPFTLFVPRRDPKTELWSGPRPGPEEAKESFAADAAHPLEEVEEHLPGLLEGARRIFFRLGRDPEMERLVVRALETARARGPRKGTGPRSVVDPGQILDELRLRKDAEEVERIRRAASLTVAGFEEALAAVAPGVGEWEVESILDSAFRRGGAQGPAFPTIAASGENACTLHYSANERIVGEGDLLLLDGGAQVDLYAGDVTRTVPAGGSFSSPQRDLYGLVLAAHDEALAAVRPGAPVGGIHEAALEVLVEGLVELGILAGDPRELLEAEAHRPWFPHQTSHWLGLDVHDVGDYARNGESRMLEPGMVLTVEPGLYVPSGAAAKSESARELAGLGVRIENDVLVTEDGAENLTGQLPVTPEEVEALVGGG